MLFTPPSSSGQGSPKWQSWSHSLPPVARLCHGSPVGFSSELCLVKTKESVQTSAPDPRKAALPWWTTLTAATPATKSSGCLHLRLKLSLSGSLQALLVGGYIAQLLGK